MEGSLSESVQQIVRPGKCVDYYYANEDTSTKACFRTSVDTKYKQAWNSLSAGTNTLTIPPNNGIGDVLCVLKLPAITTSYASLGLPAGWAYSLIKQITYRYGGTDTLALTGQQVLQAVLSQASDGASRDALMTLGGVALSGTNPTTSVNDFAGANYAYVYLPLPHSKPSVVGKPCPFPSDLLTQNIIIQVEIFPLSSIFSVATGGSTAGIPSALSSAEFVVGQVALANQGQALAQRVDMTAHSYTYPIRWIQQENPITLTTPAVGEAATQTINLTGFRNGECREIHVWLQAVSDIPVGGTIGNVVNPFKWYAPENVIVFYAGQQYANYDYGSGQLWNIVNGSIPSQVNSTILTQTGGAVVDTTPFAPAWSVLPFGQPCAVPTAHSVYLSGLPITNGQVQLQFTIPAGAPTSTNYLVHVSYVFTACLALSQGTCSYIF